MRRPFEIEYRRRLWSYLYHADKLLAECSECEHQLIMP